jgi:hypothetical protein
VRGRKGFFFEKKKQKTFGRLSRTYPAACVKWQKFFGSFFQKRTYALPENQPLAAIAALPLAQAGGGSEAGTRGRAIQP